MFCHGYPSHHPLSNHLYHRSHRLSVTSPTRPFACIHRIHPFTTDFSTSFWLDIFHHLGVDHHLPYSLRLFHPFTRDKKIRRYQTRSAWKQYRTYHRSDYTSYLWHRTWPIWTVGTDRIAILMILPRREICRKTSHACTEIRTRIIHRICDRNGS